MPCAPRAQERDAPPPQTGLRLVFLLDATSHHQLYYTATISDCCFHLRCTGSAAPKPGRRQYLYFCTIPLLFRTAAFTCGVQAPPHRRTYLRGGVSICTFVPVKQVLLYQCYKTLCALSDAAFQQDVESCVAHVSFRACVFAEGRSITCLLPAGLFCHISGLFLPYSRFLLPCTLLSANLPQHVPPSCRCLLPYIAGLFCRSISFSS